MPSLRPNDNSLILECQTFCRYLLGSSPDSYIVGKYQQAHNVGHPTENVDSVYFDGFLLFLAKRTPLLTKLADSYSRVFYPNSLLRRKLVLLLAILESYAPTYEKLDTPNANGLPQLCLLTCIRTLTFALAVLVSSIILMPTQVACALQARLLQH